MRRAGRARKGIASDETSSQGRLRRAGRARKGIASDETSLKDGSSWLGDCFGLDVLAMTKPAGGGLCRGGQIRTDDLLVPNQARYRATLRPEIFNEAAKILILSVSASHK